MAQARDTRCYSRSRRVPTKVSNTWYVPHKVVAIDGPALVLDVFSPVREDYAELMNTYIPDP
jgi:hypothetical protein